MRSALPGACLAALLAVEFVVADAVLRNKMTPAEEVYTGWILYGEKKTFSALAQVLSLFLMVGAYRQRLGVNLPLAPRGSYIRHEDFVGGKAG